jgi:hypothetical protein
MFYIFSFLVGLSLDVSYHLKQYPVGTKPLLKDHQERTTTHVLACFNLNRLQLWLPSPHEINDNEGKGKGKALVVANFDVNKFETEF